MTNARPRLLLVLLVVLVGTLLISGCSSKQAFQSFRQCKASKTAEYLDAGGSPYESTERAVTFCELTFPLLQPKLELAGPVSGHVELLGCTVQGHCPEYRLWLDQNRALVSFAVTTTAGLSRTYDRVRPTNGGDVVVFSAGAKVSSFIITESYVDVNKGKHLGE